ncbi:hypothetical protein ETU08_00205 [Apibacter muscae]|uniref:hypothetical protein n=1 Tax=Apibacter muscae TaxID=2509004 RepID=UPI0011AD396B|nr:hypothetical protein [Apibacter muscae]TWP31915.1 hypothetical protein ETU08_00205 [Apibacter muscae]
MIYDTSIPEKRKLAIDRINHLLKKKAKIEIVEKRRNRTYSQNNYLHLILSWFALNYGETLEYIKQIIFKRQVNKDLFLIEGVDKKTGEVIKYCKSTTTLNTKELTTAIERFRNFSAKEFELYLPEPKDLNHLEEIQNEIELNKEYL